MLSFTSNEAQCEPKVSSLGSAYKLEPALIPGRTKTADEGARVECVLFAESMPCPGPVVNIRLLCSLLWKSFVALDSRKRGLCECSAGVE